MALVRHTHKPDTAYARALGGWSIASWISAGLQGTHRPLAGRRTTTGRQESWVSREWPSRTIAARKWPLGTTCPQYLC